MKTTLKGLLLAGLLLVLLAAFVFLTISRVGQSSVEGWIGSQLQADINARGTLRLSFDKIDYQSPNRVVLDQLHLARVFTDGSSIDLINVEQGAIELGEIPRRGKPIVISSVELTRPIVHLDAFMKHDDRPRHATTRPQLSSILHLTHVAITDGTIDYNDGSGQQRLSWSKLSANLNLEARDAAWHHAKFAIDQSPLVKLDLSSDINLDQIAVRDLVMKLHLDLNDPAALQFFTPRLQEYIRKFDIAGKCSIDATGNGSMADRDAASFGATAALTGGRFTIGNYQLPVDHLDLAASLRGTILSLERCSIDLIGGQATANGTLELAGRQQVDMQIIGQHLGLAKLLRNGGDESKRIHGLMEGQFCFAPTLPQLRLLNKPEGTDVVWATGYVHIDHGRLVSLPIIGDLIAATRRVSNAMTGDKGVYNDQLQMNVIGIGKRYQLNDVTYMGDVIAARGHGSIAFNGDCDLIMNAGPLENLQQRLGFLGRIWGRMSDRMMSYTVQGKLKSPEVRPQLGGG